MYYLASEDKSLNRGSSSFVENKSIVLLWYKLKIMFSKQKNKYFIVYDLHLLHIVLNKKKIIALMIDVKTQYDAKKQYIFIYFLVLHNLQQAIIFMI